MDYNTVMSQINLNAQAMKPDTEKLTKERAMWQRRKNEQMKEGVTALDQEFLAKHLRECEKHIKELDTMLSAGS